MSAFKVCTAWGPGGHGFDLDDPEVGLPVIQHAHDLGVKVLCVDDQAEALELTALMLSARGAVVRTATSVEEAIQRNAQAIPVGRLGTPAEFGAVAAFIASPLAAYITGSLIRVDGGSLRSV